MNWTDLLFSFKGRTQRLYFWLTSLAVAVIAGMVSSTLEFMAKSTGSGVVNPDTNAFEPTGPFAVGIFLIAIANMWISFALSVKRLHDRDRTGWWLVVQTAVIVVAIILVVIGLAVPEGKNTPVYVVAGAVGAVAIAITFWLFIEIGFLRGTQGPNRHGPDPLGAAKADATL